MIARRVAARRFLVGNGNGWCGKFDLCCIIADPQLSNSTLSVYTIDLVVQIQCTAWYRNGTTFVKVSLHCPLHTLLIHERCRVCWPKTLCARSTWKIVLGPTTFERKNERGWNKQPRQSMQMRRPYSGDPSFLAMVKMLLF